MKFSQFKRRLASEHLELTAFLKKLDDIVPEEMPELVAEEDKKVWAETDCLSCANCCKTMTPTFTKEDIIRIAAHLQMTPKEFRAKWLYKEPDAGDWVNVTQPCQFLQADNKCSIYEVRPVDCAEFPHHHKKPFDNYNDTFIQNLAYCPATYNLVKRLKSRVEREYEW
ncbi:MAG: YkgJ family cysteine cluster protein [Rubrivivax sp.]